MDGDSLPYRAEYAKSGRSSCRTCKNAIAKDDLRIAVMVQSRMFDGKEPKWHHFTCFFGRSRPKDTAEIEHFQSLRWEDQEKIRKKIESLSGAAVQQTSKGRGKKRELPNNSVLQDFKIDYAKSGKSKCKLCEEFIPKNEIRISKKDYESEAALQYGPHERWHHVDCFLKVRKELDFYASGSVLPGYKTLAPEDQRMIKKKIPEETKDAVDTPSPAKISKKSVPNVGEEEMKKQNKLLFKYRDQLEGLKKSELICLLEYNDQEVPAGVSKILDRLADAMAFGVLKKCEKCNGQLVFQSGVGYVCTGHISEWARCDNQTLTPPRVLFKIPEQLKENYTFLEKFKGQITQRIVIETSPNAKDEEKKIKEVKQELKSAAKSSKAPLVSHQFLIHKSVSIPMNDLKSRIKELGGKTVLKFNENITAIISTEEEINKAKLAKVLNSAKESEIPILSDNFFNDVSVSMTREELIQQLKNNIISSWGTDVGKMIPSEKALVSKSSYPKKSMFKSGESIQKVTLKDGLVVDPDSKLDQVAHVYRRGNDIYSTVLSLADVQTHKNSFYKLQILKEDKKNRYWLFRAWGRIGTTIGGNKIDKFSSVEECIEEFEKLFEEKTGNLWHSRDRFHKVPGKMMMLEISYNEKKNCELVAKTELKIKSLTLHQAVQDLITLIFDIEAMKNTMLEFELDLEKMPLGKISQTQIHEAFGILSELQNSLKLQDDKSFIIDKTNRFYTLVPHDCGVNNPPLLNNEEIIKEKIEVLNSLMEIEIAFKLLQECQETGNTIDNHYKKLNAEIVVLERDSTEFQLIQTYVKNSHAQTHTNYTLEIEEIFKVDRKGEAKRYKKFSKLPNKKLLWHGSRLTNFVGILSQGLRIAPPEAPATGYMFGKGIYFADRVSKSANYCMTSKKNPTGLLLLCEVALGEMCELKNAKNIEKLPSGKHSVIGLGKTIPDPNEKAITPSGAEVPLGQGVEASIKESSLLYNEYIVYDVSQVKIQYLLRLKFNYKV